MRSVVFIAVLLCVVRYCAAKTIYVDVNGPNDPGTGSHQDPFQRIQDAIDSADNGDTVIVAEGIYTDDPNNRDLDFSHGLPEGQTRAITVRSTEPNDANVVAATIVDPNGVGRGFYFHSGEDANCIISGLTIRNGSTLQKGGAIYCDNSSPTIVNCVISENSAGLFGGGIFCDHSSPEIKGCKISGNSAQYGGGVGCWWYANPRLTNCIISDNEASYSGGGGGGLDCAAYNNVNLTNCILTRNFTAGFGGAVRCEESEVTIKNCILWGNSAAYGPQMALEFFVSNPSTISIEHSDAEGGESDVYTYPGSVLLWEGGNIDTDPCFVSFDPNGDPNMWDFHLQSAYGRWDVNSGSWVSDSNTSSCIDAGDPNSDWSGEPWPNGRRINMGAYGGTNQASKNGNIADFDIDGAADFIDFAEFSSQWLLKKLSADVAPNSSDGLVNFLDWAVFAAAWQSTQSSPNWNPGCDISPADSDGIIDVSDMAVFMDQWLQFGAYSADIGPNEGDGIVNMLDFAIFAENWLWQR